MIIDRTEDEKWLANAYLVAEGPGGAGVLIDGNGVVEPLLDRVRTEGITITHILLTHHHEDHVLSNQRYREVFPGVPFVGHAGTQEVLGAGSLDIVLADGDTVRSGSLEFRALDTPGHCQGHFAYLVGDDCFTADVLFHRTLGGHARPGGNFPQLKASTMDVLMKLPHHVRVHPGHRVPTTIGEEWEHNGFIRLWRGLSTEGTDRVTVRERGAGTLLASTPDYDGGTKNLVRLDDGTEGIFFGSWITPGG
ncbi:MAG: MBL fold metallo-hydrolase [Thermoleophilia bacterium]